MDLDEVRLDTGFVRSQFPAFAEPSLDGSSFFENAGGSYACRQTIEALNDYYRKTKVQPYGRYPTSVAAGEAMDRSHERWAEALGVDVSEVHFGPSTSANTYVLAHALAESLSPEDEIVVTNQDHEANTGAIRRAAKKAGATIVEWTVDPETGLLDPEALGAKLTSRTKLVTFPHASNIVGEENDVAQLTAMSHEAGARVIVDGVSFAPHTFPDVGSLNPDVYLFSLYKTFSVHQGLMVVRRGLIDELPNQGHYFNEPFRGKRLTPAGPDHAQEAAAGAVLDYVATLATHHGHSDGDLRSKTDFVSRLWREHETRLLEVLMEALSQLPGVRVVGSTSAQGQGRLHRCPTVAVLPGDRNPAALADQLGELGLMTGAGHFYAKRLVEAMGLDPTSGVLRLSFVHYTEGADVAKLVAALEELLG